MSLILEGVVIVVSVNFAWLGRLVSVFIATTCTPVRLSPEAPLIGAPSSGLKQLNPVARNPRRWNGRC